MTNCDCATVGLRAFLWRNDLFTSMATTAKIFVASSSNLGEIGGRILGKEARKMAVKIINISLPEELLKEIDREARKEGRTRSEFLREIARRYIEAKRASVVTSRTDLDRWTFAELSAASFNRIWDNPVDAEVWDNWEERHGKGKKVKAR